VAIFAGIVVLAFGLRVAYVLQLRSSPQFEHPAMDELYHDEWAQSIAAGKLYQEGPYFRAPLYPAFLAAVYRVCGHEYLAPRIVQALLGALGCGLVFLIGRQVFGRAVGAVAGLVAAGYWMLVYFDGELLIPTLIVPLDLLLIWLLLRAEQSPTALRFGAAGVVLGLSAIARPNVLLFAPAIVIWLLLRQRGAWRRALLHAAAITAGCLLVVLPITVRNYVVGKDLVLIAAQGGVNFYIGNNPASDGRTAVVPGTPADWWGGYRATVARAEAARGRTLKASEVSDYYYEQAWQFIRQQPAQALRLLGLKLLLFWRSWEISNNKDIYFWTAEFTPLLRYLPIGFGVVGPLGLVGLALCWRRRGELFPLWGFVLIYMVSIVIFFCTSRYRMPVVPVLILLGTHAAFQSVATVRERRWKAAGCWLLLLAVAVAFVNSPIGPQRYTSEPLSQVMVADAYDRQGDKAQAIEHFRRAAELEPGYLMAQHRLGVLLLREGRLPEAVAALRAAATATPNLSRGETMETVAAAHYDLGLALDKSNQPVEAAAAYQAALELNPTVANGKAAWNLAVLLAQLGREDEAVTAYGQVIKPFRAVLAERPDDMQALYGLGRSLYVVGRYDEALAPLRRVVALQPNHLMTLDCLSDALLRTGHYDEAIRLLRQALPLNKNRLMARLALLLAASPDDALRDGAEALRLAQHVCPQVAACPPVYLDALAAALAETGDFAQAAEIAGGALERARAAAVPDAALVANLEARCALYRAGRPCRLSTE
jgi:tetratricopeptide (TPR) repeat protein